MRRGSCSATCAALRSSGFFACARDWLVSGCVLFGRTEYGVRSGAPLLMNESAIEVAVISCSEVGGRPSSMSIVLSIELNDVCTCDTYPRFAYGLMTRP